MARRGGVPSRSGRIVAVSLALVALASCNSRLLRPPATIFVDGGESSVPVAVGPQLLTFPAVLTAFFPSTVQLHPGDSVRFDLRSSGEPHTVALGTIVTDAVKAIGGSGGSVADAEKTDAMKRVPSVFPSHPDPDAPKVDRSAAERCFLDSGSPPVTTVGGAPACVKRDQPDFDGTQAFYSSGFLPEGEGFRMKLSGSIAPGSYPFMCLVHRSRMVGTLEVVDPGTERPTVREVKIAGGNEQDVVEANVVTAAKEAAGATDGIVRAGAGPTGESRGFASAFIPEETEVAADGEVTWQLYGMHTITFRPQRRAKDGILLEDRDGGVRINLDAWRPVGSSAVPAGALSSVPPKDGVEVDGGAYDGEGTFSSGILRAPPASNVRYELRFAKSGTYDYVCLVHDRMRGRIVVG